MNGKILKVSSNDLYGNADDRLVAVFAAFNHLKYMNKYVIFAFQDKYNEAQLCYGSVHIKNDAIVIFAIDNNDIIDDFVNKYLTSSINLKEYEFIDISKINKVELVSYSEMPFDKLNTLDELSIKRENKVEDNKKNNKSGFLYALLIIMILLLISVTYLYFNPDILKVKLKSLNCTKETYDNKIELNYISSILVRFNKEEKIRSIERIDTYTFLNRDDYYDFKNNHKESTYFNVNGSYKYNDDFLELKIIYAEKLIIDNYNEISQYYKKEGYSCIEEEYNE